MIGLDPRDKSLVFVVYEEGKAHVVKFSTEEAISFGKTVIRVAESIRLMTTTDIPQFEEFEANQKL